MKKRGLSEVVSTIILIVLVVIAASVVWAVVNKMIKEQTKSSNCLDVFEKVYLDNLYTCYNDTNNNLIFFIGIKDLDVDSVLVSVSGDSGYKSFEIPEKSAFTNLKMIDGSTNVELPGKNAGFSYKLDLGGLNIGKPYSIEVAPIIGGKQCEVSSSIKGIDNCQLLV